MRSAALASSSAAPAPGDCFGAKKKKKTCSFCVKLKNRMRGGMSDKKLRACALLFGVVCACLCVRVLCCCLCVR